MVYQSDSRDNTSTNWSIVGGRAFIILGILLSYKKIITTIINFKKNVSIIVSWLNTYGHMNIISSKAKMQHKLMDIICINSTEN